MVPGGAQAAHARGDVRSQQAVKQLIQSLACPQAVHIAFAQSQVAVGQNAFGNAVSQQVDVPGPRPVKAHICEGEQGGQVPVCRITGRVLAWCWPSDVVVRHVFHPV